MTRDLHDAPPYTAKCYGGPWDGELWAMQSREFHVPSACAVEGIVHHTYRYDESRIVPRWVYVGCSTSPT